MADAPAAHVWLERAKRKATRCWPRCNLSSRHRSTQLYITIDNVLVTRWVTSELRLEEFMKITDVRARLLSYLIPPERRHRNDYGWVVKHDTIIVEGENDEDIIGIGTGIGRASPSIASLNLSCASL